ncbi:MAG: fructose-specific PTS transporter subunit EIIC [Eubacterium sp.]|nr:fructose-specific PTS transporter subunit EIIC [Eubacterium sp.]
MRITDLLKADAIRLGVAPSNKREAIDLLIELHDNCGNLLDREKYEEGILAREEMGTTAIGMEVAIPHAKSEAVKAPALSAITVPDGVDYDSPDGADCKLLFMIAATTDGDVHLEVLARLMQLLMDESFTSSLKKAETPEEFLSLIDAKETEKFPEETAAPAASEDGYQILAVTACPTGIAHTYMAAEALAKAGEEMGVTIKVETNGSGGAKNVLTKKDIENCQGIIIAADKSVETARFDGKPVLSTKVADGIHKPEELIQKVLDGKVPTFKAEKADASSSDSDSGDSIGRKLYKHLMNGVSHMLPFVVAGGIFIAIAFLIDTIAGVKMDGNFGSGTAVSAWLKGLGGEAFGIMLPVLAGFIAMSIADRPGFLVGVIGGFLAKYGSTFKAIQGDDLIPSGFLGALLAGFLAGWLMKMVMKLCNKLPDALEGIKPVLIYPLAGLGIVGVMMCAVNPFMGYLNTGLSDGLTWLNDHNLGLLLGFILAAMMAIDMGGPFNKAAYVFGTGMLTTAAGLLEKGLAVTDPKVVVCYEAMAAVMIGGMVPPIAIALSTTLFKDHWSESERKNGVVNYIMGLSFITEGAIPYAASYPLKVIPACMIGSGVAGFLSWLFKCQLMAPHGGIFVFATVKQPLLYILSLIVGSAVACIILTVLKGKNKEA